MHAQGTPGLGLLALTREAEDFAPGAARALADVGGTWIVTVAPGILTERGELQGVSAAVGLTLPGVHGGVVLETSGLPKFAQDLAVEMSGGRGALVLSPGDFQDGELVPLLRQELGTQIARVLGAGTPPGFDHYFVHHGEVRSVRSLAIVFGKSWVPHIASSAGCRLLSPLLRVNKVRERSLLELEGTPALTALSEAAKPLEESPLILLALAVGEDPLSGDGRNLALRPIVGVDPGRGSIDLAEELPLGARVAFAVRDGHAARTDLDAHLRSLRQSCCGAVPAFGIYLQSSGRGRPLYDADDVDVRLIRSHFPDMPLLGLQSVVELAAMQGQLTTQFQSGVLGVFCAPS